MKLDVGRQREAGLLAHMAQRIAGVRSDEGNALLELAITLPMMMLILTIFASFSLAFYNLQELENATTSAVVLVATKGRQTGSDPCNMAMNSVQKMLPGWTAANISYTLTITNGVGTQTAPYSATGTTFNCAQAGGSGAAATAVAEYEPVKLSVSYTYPWMKTFNFAPWWGNFSPSGSISATETMMVE